MQDCIVDAYFSQLASHQMLLHANVYTSQRPLSSFSSSLLPESLSTRIDVHYHYGYSDHTTITGPRLAKLITISVVEKILHVARKQ